MIRGFLQLFSKSVKSFNAKFSGTFLSFNLDDQNEKILMNKIKEVMELEKDNKIQALEVSETYSGTKRSYRILVKYLGSDIIKTYYVNKK